ncbi:MAG TPA: HAD family phosphatase [Gemmatimonadales bacterium]|nr:HAD family phosphatase [Gemmatimonadales bacterium]
MSITHLFFDVGGVLGSNGWDHTQRAAAARHFGLEPGELEEMHGEAKAMLEMGRMTLDEYLKTTVFYRPRPFAPETFKQFMFALSTPSPEAIELARALARTGRYRLMTINNESAELNQHRIECFGLKDIFTAFFSSCWVGVLKPARRIYEVALGMAQARPGESVFIDDRERNLEPARVLGMRTIAFSGVGRLREELAGMGVET